LALSDLPIRAPGADMRAAALRENFRERQHRVVEVIRFSGCKLSGGAALILSAQTLKI
jgi:hypothetical protein